MNIIHGDCLEELKKLDDNSVDAVITDPPYGLSNTKPAQVADVLKAWVTGDTVSVPAKRGGFMGKDWDSFVPPPAVWEECMRVLKPGGHMAVFAGARTQDLMGLSIRLAGFEIRDTLGWVYGCLSEDTEVLINGEWVQYDKAKVGDLALCYNKEYDTYEWKPIEDTHKYEYGDTAYRIHSNNTDQIVSRNHRVLVERGGAYEFEYAENLAREHQIRVPVLESLPTLLNDLSMREPISGGEEQVLQRELRNVRPATGGGETDGGTRNDGDCMCSVRDEGIQAERLVEESGNPNMLERVQREVARGRIQETRTQGARSMVGGNESAVRGEPARGEQSGLEGRGYPKEGARELQGCSVCSMSTRVPEHVTEGRVCDGAPSSGGEGFGSPSIANRSGASCEPRSGGQSVGEPVSVRVESGSQAVRGARYTVADLADIEPVHYEGVVWCLTVPTGAFVVRRNGKVFVTGNSGFPKSMDVSKAIDKTKKISIHKRCGSPVSTDEKDITLLGDDGESSGYSAACLKCDEDLFPFEIEQVSASEVREKVGSGSAGAGFNPVKGFGSGVTTLGDEVSSQTWDVTAPATPEAAQWDGWGTALKPAIEPIILARKPLVGTVAANVLAHGVGGLNIDACRVQIDGGERELIDNRSGAGFGTGATVGKNMGRAEGVFKSHSAGRFPANVLLDEHAAKEMDKQSGKAGAHGVGRGERTDAGVTGWSSDNRETHHNDSGGASRFFPVFKYQAKAPKKERPVIELEDGSKIQHPTVKPLALLEWLVELITPPNGVVLDPFAGSGTTLQAALNKGFQPIGIEQDADYIKLIEKRLEGLCTTHKN